MPCALGVEATSRVPVAFEKELFGLTKTSRTALPSDVLESASRFVTSGVMGTPYGAPSQASTILAGLPCFHVIKTKHGDDPPLDPKSVRSFREYQKARVAARNRKVLETTA